MESETVPSKKELKSLKKNVLIFLKITINIFLY